MNVGILSIAIGHALGFSRSDLANLGLGALLHDVGKLTIPIEVLAKPRPSRPGGVGRSCRRHPLEGVKTVTRMPGLSTLTIDVLDVCLYHHRRVDGSGYPEVVPAACHRRWRASWRSPTAMTRMTTHRAYRARPFTGYEALHTLVGPDRAYYDPAALWALVQTVGVYPAGTLLETASGHMVLSLNNDREDLRRPQCRVLARPGWSTSAPRVRPRSGTRCRATSRWRAWCRRRSSRARSIACWPPERPAPRSPARRLSSAG